MSDRAFALRSKRFRSLKGASTVTAVVLNKILLLEPSHFEEYPVCRKSIDFLINLAKENIPSIQIYVGEFKDLIKNHLIKEVYYKEHPTNNDYDGKEESRDWMFEVNGYYPSFFTFWKKCKKQLDY